MKAKTKVLITIIIVAALYFSSVGAIMINNAHKTKCHATYVVDGKVEYRKSLHKN